MKEDMKNKGIKFSKIILKITALVIIQAFLVLDFAWCGGNELFSKQANSDTLAPHLTIDKEATVKALFLRGLLAPGQEEIAPAVEPAIEQPVAEPSRTGFAAKVLGYVVSVFLADGALSLLSAAVSKAGIISTGISLSGIIPILIPAIVMVGIVAMIGGKAGDWASNLFVGFVKDGRITTEEAVRQAKEQEIIKIRKELYRLINDHKMFDLIGGSYYRINTNVFRENGMAGGIISANLKRELNINNDNELVVMYGLARQIAEFIETFQYLKKINLIEERLDVVNSGLIYGVDLNWDYKAEYINAGGDIGRGRYIPVDSFEKDKAKAVLNALGRLSQIGYEIDILDGERQIVPKGNRMKRQQSSAKPAQQIQKEKPSDKIAKDLIGQAKQAYDTAKRKLNDLKTEKDMHKIVDGMWTFLNNLRDYYYFEIDNATGKIVNVSGIKTLRRDIPCIVIQDLHALSDQFADIFLTEINGVSVLRLLVEGKLQVVLLGDIMHSEDQELMEKIKDEFWALNDNAEVKQMDFAIYISDLIEKEGEIPAGLKNMYEEATRSLKTAAMVMLLKQSFKDNVLILKGNHDNIKNDNDARIPGFDKDDVVKEGYGNMYFNKFIVFPGDGEAYKAFYKAMFGQEFIDAYAIWDNVMEIAALMGPVVFTHGPSWKELTFEQIEKRDPEAVRALIGYQMFRYNDRPENHKLLVNDFLQVMKSTLLVHGHRHGLKFDKVNNRFVLNQQGKLTGTAFLPGEKYDGETAEKNVFTADNMSTILGKLSTWASVSEPETPASSEAASDATATSFRPESTVPVADRREYFSLPKEGVVLDTGEEHAFIYQSGIPARVILGASEKQAGYTFFVIEQKGNEGAFNYLADISDKGARFAGTFGTNIISVATVGSKGNIKINKIPEPVAPAELKAGASEQEKSRHKLAQERYELDKERFDALQEQHAVIYFDGGRNIRVLDTSTGKRTRIESARFPARDIKINRSQFSYYHDAANGPVEILAAPGKDQYKLTINFNEQTDEFEISGEGIETKKIKVIRDDNGEININKIQVYTFGKRQAGENDTTHIQLATKSGYVSSRHGEIQLNGLFVTIRDYSTNGTLARSVKSPAPSPSKAEPKKAPPVANYTVKYVYNLFKLYVVESQDIKALQKAIDYLAANQPGVLKATIKEILEGKDTNLNDNDYLKIKN
ncbi:MAG: hypothetical protein KJ710_01165, partial [Candidatus Omnitrophica bacterium]|nr:hypothetical protein [Candidatus Omnitrophota bacterium]